MERANESTSKKPFEGLFTSGTALDRRKAHGVSFSIRGIDNGLWNRFRKMCLDEGISTQKKIAALIEDAVTQSSGGQDAD